MLPRTKIDGLWILGISGAPSGAPSTHLCSHLNTAVVYGKVNPRHTQLIGTWNPKLRFGTRKIRKIPSRTVEELIAKELLHLLQWLHPSHIKGVSFPLSLSCHDSIDWFVCITFQNEENQQIPPLRRRRPPRNHRRPRPFDFVLVTSMAYRARELFPARELFGKTDHA